MVLYTQFHKMVVDTIPPYHITTWLNMFTLYDKATSVPMVQNVKNEPGTQASELNGGEWIVTWFCQL